MEPAQSGRAALDAARRRLQCRTVLGHRRGARGLRARRLRAGGTVRAERREITRIRLAYEAMEQAAEHDDVPAAIQADKDFHLAILAATGNPILQAFDTAIDAVLGQLFKAAIEIHMESFRKNLVNHLRVLEAIEQRRPEEARQAMLDMIGITRRHLEKYELTKPIS
ncbi:FadR/GntR family transcriptional regulator [Ponticoccus litoralis]|uniref:FCD domain-containing protein n=1 Tax=Ponticoccus litoralis TaxID=422297 RepID=A0AAW9SMR2_9RHOB